MKPILYKIETYVVPEENLSVVNNIDNLNIAKQFNTKSENISKNNALFASHNKYEEFAMLSAESSKLIDIKLVKNVTNENKSLFDEQCDNDIVKYYNNNNFHHSVERVCVPKMEFQASIGPEEKLYPAKQFSRINSLMSIDERSENSLDTKLNDFCRHGYKNGCTASIPSPEEVSEEIFRENWLQKIEVLRNRETILRDKEMNLQKRERELFRKEKELRIMERVLNDKFKQVDKQLKQQEDVVVEKRLEEAARILFDDIAKYNNNLSEEKISQKNITKKEDISNREEVPKKKEEISNKVEIPRKIEIPRKVEIPKKTEISNNPQSIINLCENKEEYNEKIIRSSTSSRKSFSRIHSQASIRRKQQSKIIYDDLNSTLSAASVDTPNVRTSQWFNPMQYKKPHVFTRSASERRPQHKDIREKLQKIVEEPKRVIEEEKIFRKVSNNICALQEKNAKFQNYGLVDCIPSGASSMMERNFDNEEKLSYLDIEIGERRSLRTHQSLHSISKNRPVSWASETHENWLKKCQVHDSKIKQSTENKENAMRNARYIAEKIWAKNKPKKFSLFG